MVKTFLVSFHSYFQQESTKHPSIINIVSSSSDNTVAEEVATKMRGDINDKLSSVIGNLSMFVSTTPSPIRFKLADNDSPDLNYPLQIPSQSNVVYYSYRKQLKLLFYDDSFNTMDPNSIPQVTISNLRFYVDTGIKDAQNNQTLGEGVLLEVSTQSEYVPPSVNDVTNGLTEATKDNQLKYKFFNTTDQNLLVLNPNIVWVNSNMNSSFPNGLTQQEQLNWFYNKWFGNQPYLYLIVGLMSTAEPKNYNLAIYFVYDEI